MHYCRYRIRTCCRKVACLALLGVPLLSAGCAAPRGSVDPWFARDKAYHFAGGFCIGAVVATAGVENGAGDGEAVGLAVALTMAIGSGKELYDLRVRRTFWSWKDTAWNLLGAAAGSLMAVQFQ